MGTRSLTRIIPRQEGLSYSDGHTRGELAIVNAYQQYDGYPESMAVELAEWLQSIVIGTDYGDGSKDHAKDAYCLAAQYVAKFKKGAGNFYLRNTDNELGWVEYIYTIYPKIGHHTYMSIYHVTSRSVIFVGKPDKALKQYKTNTKQEG